MLRTHTLLIALLFTAAFPANAAAETGIAPAASLGMFFEFGDEAGFSGGFALWGGATIYPDVDPSSDGAAFFLAPGLEVRTGAIPLLTGPNQISPQLRAGVAFLGPPGERMGGTSSPDGLTFPDLKLSAILGYRWAFEFGLDNLDRRRRNEDAFRLGFDVSSAGLLRLTDPIPVLNMVGGIVDVNTDGSIDRYGFTVGLGF